jgi:acyl-CoA reductase-like NAD-dependent aldehyde dehydrogenase
MSALEPRAVRELASTLIHRGAELHDTPPDQRAEWLARACAMLRDPGTAHGRAVRAQVPASSGLSAPMVDWALESSLAPLTADALLELESVLPPHPRATRARPGQLCAVVLAGNVFTAALRAIMVPLLYGYPVLAKASSHDAAFADLLFEALRESDVQLCEAFRVLAFSSEDEELTQALFEQADVVSAYGSDNTLNRIRSSLSASVSFVGHGHGLSAAIVGAEALHSKDHASLLARGLALDVAAYDQRGCMSPHAIWVQRGGAITPRALAELLMEELETLGRELPRGDLAMADASAQLSWRGVSTLRGELFEGDGFAVSYEESAPLRVSPGQRNVQVIAVDYTKEACDKLAPLGVHLKCLALAGIPARTLELAPRLAPRVCPPGQMQTPPLQALHDGVPAWEGFVRWVDAQ